MTKSFKIGEYAVGGIIKVDYKRDSITVSALDYNTKKTVQTQTFGYDQLDQIEWFVNYLTTSYYTDKVMNHIKNAIK